MLPYTINGKAVLIDRQEIDLPAFSILPWLEAQPLYPKIFWKDKETKVERAALGNLLTFSSLPLVDPSQPCPLRFYGGKCFHIDGIQDAHWRPFPRESFWLPEIEMIQTESGCKAIVTSLGAPAQIPSFLTEQAAEARETPTVLHREELPSFSQWQHSVEKVLSAINAKNLDKLVLARKTLLQFSHPLSPWPLLAKLNQRARSATLFAFHLSPDVCFLGATPEKLFARKGTTFNTDAVAGTRPRGKTAEEDLQLERELAGNPKDQKEFQIVKNFLSSALAPLSDEMAWQGPDTLLKTSHVQHLYNRLTGTLKPATTDSDLIRALHPTPALGGYPRAASLALLKELEPFERGWYGSPIGFVSQEETSIYVAIRSALMHQNSLHLFAGTGLVPGSHAEMEWAELEHKIQPFLELLL